MITNYYYDGSFDGLLTAVYEAYYRKESPSGIYPDSFPQQSLCEKHVHIPTDYEKAARVYNAIDSKISGEALENVYYAYLSEMENISTHIYDYLKMGFKVGKSIDLHLSDDRVLRVHSAARKVRRECHLMLGLLRFKKFAKDLYYAAYSPDNNITVLICPHFKDRLSDQNWIIHDVKRNLAGVYDKEECVFIDLPSDFQYSIEANGDTFENLWKEYYKSICIKERKNLKLHKQLVPVRYWKYLTEKQN